MNIEKLKRAEKLFLERFPGGFENPGMIAIVKKHRMEQMTSFTRESFAKGNFKNPALVVENMSKVISRASMISLFEKPKFRYFVASLPPGLKRSLAAGLEELLHGEEQTGFEELLEVLKTGKLGHWPVMTIFQTYYRPDLEVFIKPTTTKWVIETFELDGLHYNPTPAWDFYREYRAIINDMKSRVDPFLSPSNAAFTGFLMMSMPGR
jgi:hypothetical protein